MSYDIDEIRKHIKAVTSTNIPAIRAHNLVGDINALLDEVDRLRVELRDARTDLLDVRGILSPNGYPARVPADVPMVPAVAPAVKWLADEVDRLTELLAFRDREIAGHRAENERLRDEVDEALAPTIRRTDDESLADGVRALHARVHHWREEADPLRAENERLTHELEVLRGLYEACQSAEVYHRTSAELLRGHLAEATAGEETHGEQETGS